MIGIPESHVILRRLVSLVLFTRREINKKLKTAVRITPTGLVNVKKFPLTFEVVMIPTHARSFLTLGQTLAIPTTTTIWSR